ncbi:HD domain-containing protein [Rhizobium sp. SIMBA_035]
MFEHSTRVYLWGALAGHRNCVKFDPELLFTAAMFHDVGLTAGFSTSRLRFEIDGANAASDFLRSHGVSEENIQKVWLAIALHTTPGIPAHLDPIGALTAEGVMMDLVGAGYDRFTEDERTAVEAAYPRGADFAGRLLQALYDGLEHRPEVTQGTGLADVMADKNPHFHRRNFCCLMRSSPWACEDYGNN